MSIFYLDKDPDEYWGSGMSIVAAVSHSLIILNSSTNFIIYCYKEIQDKILLGKRRYLPYIGTLGTQKKAEWVEFSKFSHYFFREIFAFVFSRNFWIFFCEIFVLFFRIIFFAKFSHFLFHENFRMFREKCVIFVKLFFLFAGNPSPVL